MYVRRKVYSYSEPEEQLYSVTMTKDEYDLFSAVLDEYYNDYDLYSDISDVESGRDIGQLAGGALGAGGAGLGTYYYLKGMENRGKNALSKAQDAKRAAKEAAYKGETMRAVELEKLNRMSDAEWNAYKLENKLSKNLKKADYLGAKGEFGKRVKNAAEAEAKAIENAKKAGERAVRKMNRGAFLAKHKKLVGAAAATAAAAGLAAGANLGRPIGGAVNRRHND